MGLARGENAYKACQSARAAGVLRDFLLAYLRMIESSSEPPPPCQDLRAQTFEDSPPSRRHPSVLPFLTISGVQGIKPHLAQQFPSTQVQ